MLDREDRLGCLLVVVIHALATLWMKQWPTEGSKRRLSLSMTLSFLRTLFVTLFLKQNLLTALTNIFQLIFPLTS